MIYTIKNGSHRSRWIPSFTFKNNISGKIRFLSDMSYKINKQKDTNKLIGISDGWHHHKNSIRIGWRYNDGLEIMVITYTGGKRTIESLGYVSPNKEYFFRIQLFNGVYAVHFVSSDNEIRYSTLMDRTSKWSFLRYKLFPYFGGTEKAPKEFNISITK